MLILNKACLRYEPDDPEFIRVTHRVYEYINEQQDFGILHSTRFYGPLLFYLAWFKKVENIIAHHLNNSLIDECAEIISLHSIVNEVGTKQVFNSPIEFIQVIFWIHGSD